MHVRDVRIGGLYEYRIDQWRGTRLVKVIDHHDRDFVAVDAAGRTGYYAARELQPPADPDAARRTYEADEADTRAAKAAQAAAAEVANRIHALGIDCLGIDIPIRFGEQVAADPRVVVHLTVSEAKAFARFAEAGDIA